MYYHRTTCRACGNTALVPVFSLGVQPLANEFVREGEPVSGFVPLEVMFCEVCSLAQLSVVVDPAVLYRNYAYVTSPSQTMQQHFERLLSDIRKEADLSGVVEIGSNDGKLLEFLQKHGAGECVGIDPATNLCSQAAERHVTTLCTQFNTESANAAKDIVRKVDVVLARHVFAHVDDWRQFISDLERLTDDHSLVCIEVPDTSKLLESVAFDTVYHEHLSYVTVRSVLSLLADSRFYVHKVIKYPLHGGSMLLMLRRGDAAQRGMSFVAYSKSENVTLERWLEFAHLAQARIHRLKSVVDYFAVMNRRICGFGASAKSSVWMNACGFTPKQIRFITDTTPEKIGRVSPGTHIPIVNESELAKDPSGLYAIMFAWNYREEILQKHSEFLKKGGRFIVPVPQIDILGDFKGSNDGSKTAKPNPILDTAKSAPTSEIPKCANDTVGKISEATR